MGRSPTTTTGGDTEPGGDPSRDRVWAVQGDAASAHSTPGPSIPEDSAVESVIGRWRNPTVSPASIGIISFAPIVFVKEAAWNGGEHGTAIRSEVGGNVGGCGSLPRDARGDAEPVGDLRRAVRGDTRRARPTTPRPRVTTGLLSDLKHKTGEAIAYLHDQKRQGIQKFIGHVPWDHQPLFATLADQLASSWGNPTRSSCSIPRASPRRG